MGIQSSQKEIVKWKEGGRGEYVSVTGSWWLYLANKCQYVHHSAFYIPPFGHGAVTSWKKRLLFANLPKNSSTCQAMWPQGLIHLRISIFQNFAQLAWIFPLTDFYKSQELDSVFILLLQWFI